MSSAMLDPGQHVVHELSQGRRAWLHIVQGKVTMDDVVLCAGDGAGVTAEGAVSFTAQEKAEILLVDLGVELPGSMTSRPSQRGTRKRGVEHRRHGETTRRNVSPETAVPIAAALSRESSVGRAGQTTAPPLGVVTRPLQRAGASLACAIGSGAQRRVCVCPGLRVVDCRG